MTNDKEKKENYNDKNTALPPDEETLHTPDPQENMEGPVSSTIQKLREGFDTHESKKEADKKREEHM